MSLSALRNWAVEQALPVWGSIGFDAEHGQFVEQIGFDRQPMLEASRRVMVQARQIYVFGLAHERGWFADGDRLALSAYRQLIKRYGTDGAGTAGWAFATDRQGRVADSTRDLYAQAFVLLALATIARLDGGTGPLKLARETLAFLDARMASPSGGYLEALPATSVSRRQNPHMHLLEALLAWHEVAPEAGFDARALQIARLLKARFLVRLGDKTALVEHFDATLAPLGGPDFGFEPGHHFEWAWLLGECKRLTGEDFSHEAESLWSSATRSGFRDDGAIFDEVSLTGRLIQGGVRLWPLTEAIKAERLGYVSPEGGQKRDADTLAQSLLKQFIEPAPAGLWFDHFDRDGRLKRNNAPASSLYHLCCALAQYPDCPSNASAG
ncbi:MAG TPA: AGE family epimerase/isomerase [Bosea sp. (in: a-proteobacteria)]|uniref:AGE family epimerase/isomerase n=1 Tax=Bosea sp. (in: a-proteobacteria) TaxID=1871050 RepID=UPI002E110F73|nr:AGE family epimerase/isomerase [Bosea sp. (in: a-proteobacteria)]